MKETSFIKIEDLYFAYNSADRNPSPVLKSIDLAIERGSYVTIIGQNGSGKSTLSRHLNALLLPTAGNVWVKGLNTRDSVNLRAIRQTIGMVFQNPDNQIVATMVEEDVAFGPENLGLTRSEIEERVDSALGKVDALDLRERSPHLLSGGQKQRVAIAGALAMNSECLVLDEATAMLDPAGRRQVLDTVKKLNGSGITIIAVTHYMEEALEADRVLVMQDGRIAMDGTPRGIFSQAERLRKMDLDVPQVTQLADRLHRRLSGIRGDALTPQELTEDIIRVQKRVPALARGGG